MACAHFGGYVLGSDIDHVLLHGRGYTSRAKVEQKYRGKTIHITVNHSFDMCIKFERNALL